MLNKKEVAVMRAVYEACKINNDCAIMSDARIISATPEKYKLTLSEVDTILKQLEYDGYFECVKSTQKGQTVNVISLKQKGKAFAREVVQRRRELYSTMLWRIAFAALGAVAALAANRLLALMRL